MWNFQVTEHQTIENPCSLICPTSSTYLLHTQASEAYIKYNSHNCICNISVWKPRHLLGFWKEMWTKLKMWWRSSKWPFFRELQAWAVCPKEGSQRDTVVESSNDCLMRWEKQDKKDQNGLNKSLGIRIWDSLAISIVTLHHFLLLSCLRPIEMRSSTSQTICWNHFKSQSDVNDQWPRVECSEVNGRWMADNSIHLNGELLSEHSHGLSIHLITSFSVPYLPSSLLCKVSSYFIF